MAESLVIQQQLAHDYAQRDNVIIELSNEMPEAWLWRDGSSCWLHLNDWSGPGSLARSQIDCNADWTGLVTPFRELLDRKFRRLS